jgi:hypothetical protein
MDRAAPIAGTGLAAEKATEACACPLISQLAKTDDAHHAQPLKNGPFLLQSAAERNS